MRPDRAISGHVFRVDGKRHSVWRAKYRLPRHARAITPWKITMTLSICRWWRRQLAC